MRRDITRRPGVDVLVPGPPQGRGLLQDDVIDAQLLQADAGVDAGDAAAHDHGVVLVGIWTGEGTDVLSAVLICFVVRMIEKEFFSRDIIKGKMI